MEMTMTVYNGRLRTTLNEHRIDTAVAVRFKDMMKDLTTRETGRVVVDLSAVNFVDSGGLGAVVGSKSAWTGSSHGFGRASCVCR